MEHIYEKEYPVHYYELDMGGRIQPVTLLNYLQDAAASHALQLGVAVRDLMEKNLTWVLSRFHLQIARHARGGELLTVRTWPSLRGERFTCREFEVGDEEGKIVAKATSSWAVLDLGSRRPVSLEGRLPCYPLVPQRAIADDFPTLPRLARADRQQNFQVRRSDLDINHHVNNAVYAGWALDGVPDTLAASFLPKEIEIGFRAEALSGDTVVASCEQRMTPDGEPCLIHQITSARDGRELTRLRTRWSRVDG